MSTQSAIDIRPVGILGLLLMPLICHSTQPTISWDSRSGRATVKSGRLELVIDTASGINPRLLRDTKLGEAYADRDYAWPGGVAPKLVGAPVVSERAITFKGRLGDLQIEQVFTTPGIDAIVERITIRNVSGNELNTSSFKCGFARTIAGNDPTRVCPVPYRRETNGEMQDFPLVDVTKRKSGYSGWAEPYVPTDIWGAEGWVWSKGSCTVLISKYNSNSMEWSLMEPFQRGKENLLRFGGAGQWKHGSPERSGKLAPGKSYTFGETRIQAIDGDWKQAYYAYRKYTDAKGCKTPKAYNPPVHWNELYDNSFYFKLCEAFGPYFAPGGKGFCDELNQTSKKLAEDFYSIDLMKLEASKAKDLGCESLYLDPGWDYAGPRLHVWDDKRLGSMDSFVKMLNTDYGLGKVSLWCSLAGMPPTYGDPAGSPLSARVKDKEGKLSQLLVCIPSPGFLDCKEERLLELCKHGAGFLMFDSNQYTGPCYDAKHGHSIPSTREEHANALIQLAQRVRSKYPSTFIEMHDPVTGPSSIHYTPTYYGYDRKNSFTELWGHEFMWGPLDDILSRRAVSLYYFNLAYSIPLYLHVNLQGDNEHSLILWWFASTCRHLGVGGKPAEPVWSAEKLAMKKYLSLKKYFTQGTFRGVEEEIHVHVLKDSFVVNVFNLNDTPRTVAGSVSLKELGLDPKRTYVTSEPWAKCVEGRLVVSAEMAGRDAKVLEFKAKNAK